MTPTRIRWASTKFVVCMTAILGLFVAAAFGKFTGELGLYISAITGAYVTGNTLITKASLANGRHAEP